jgi:hypothetical protein
MKHITALFMTLGLVFFSTHAFAQKGMSYSMAGIEGGFKWNSASVTNSDSNKQVIGFQFGVSTVLDFSQSFGIKTGLFYTERPFESTFANGTNVKGKLTYFEVPAFFMLKFEDYAGVYIGPSFGIKLSEEVSPGKLTSTKDFIVPITVGAQFKFMPNLGVNVFFETIPGELATGLENSRAVGVNLMFTLD